MRRFLHQAGVVVLAGSVVVAAYIGGVFDTWQDQLTDRLFLEAPQPEQILIVSVDEAALAAFGQWPFPRAVFGHAVDRLQGARRIGIDIHFAEPSRWGETDDAAFAQALARATPPVVLPVELTADGLRSTAPLAAFQAESERGFVNVIVSADGVVRSLSSERSDLQGGREVSFSRALLGTTTAIAIPERIRIAYIGGARTFLTISLADVVAGTVPESVINDAYVLIGATAPSLRDVFETPFGFMPGVEIHANALQTMREGVYLSDVAPMTAVLLLLMACAVTGAAVAYVRRLTLLALCVVALLGGFIGVAAFLFAYGIVIPLLYMLGAVVLTGGAMLAREYVAESKEKRFIRDTFERYVSGAVMAELMAHPEKLTLGGEKKRITVLFSDIRGFTTLSENLSPEALTQIMNEYLSAMTDAILAHGGLVDKYIGDAIMAFWGAPVDDPAQETHAVEAVLVMRDRLAELNALWGTRGLPPVRIGIGVTTGEAVVGNMGSTQRFNYTAMGDEVNFASRLEGITKEYGTTCLVSKETYDGVAQEQQCMFREIDTVRVKGKSKSRTIYELRATGRTEPSHSDFAEGRRAYQEGRWDKAIECFHAILRAGPDPVTETLAARAEYFKKHPPHDWDGTYDFETK